MRILTIGDIKRDTFVALPDASLLCKKHGATCSICFAYGEKIPVGAFFSQPGGTAPNVALGLRKLGHSAGVISSVSNDAESDEALSFLRAHEVDTTHVLRNRNHLMTSAIVLNFQGESTQLIAHNETAHQFPKKLSPPDLLHIAEMSDGYTEVFRDVLAYQKKTVVTEKKNSLRSSRCARFCL
jgi:sugar/nucleoside kinase (ribokinase family)